MRDCLIVREPTRLLCFEIIFYFLISIIYYNNYGIVNKNRLFTLKNLNLNRIS